MKYKNKNWKDDLVDLNEDDSIAYEKYKKEAMNPEHIKMVDEHFEKMEKIHQKNKPSKVFEIRIYDPYSEDFISQFLSNEEDACWVIKKLENRYVGLYSEVIDQHVENDKMLALKNMEDQMYNSYKEYDSNSEYNENEE